MSLQEQKMATGGSKLIRKDYEDNICPYKNRRWLLEDQK
jgi:hypothetical protein